MAKTELEEAGLETEGMVESTAKLRSEILALSGVDIMENANEFKSTYKIMDELAQKWEDLSDIQQASITELIAGKRQGNVVSSLMQNFDIAREALETSLNSSGSAMKEHEKWQQSLEARLNKLKSTWQSLSQTFMSSDFLKTTLDAVIGLVNGIDKLIDTLGLLPTLFTGLAIFKSFTGKGFFKVIEDEASASGKKITSVFGQAAASIKQTFSSSFSFGAGFEASLNSDVMALNNYIAQLKAGVPAEEAFAQTMREASAEAQHFAQNMNTATMSASQFKTIARQSQITEQAASFKNAKSLINEYNDGLKNCGLTQTQFIDAVGKSNTNFAKYLSGVKQGEASLGKYIVSLIGTKAATIGLQIATAALNATLTMGISLIVSGLFSGISKLINAEKELAEKVSEVTSKFKEQHEELRKLKGDYDSSNESSMISKYEKLSKGVDSLGRNVSLTADEYSEYQSIVNKIAEQVPSIVAGYDEQGNAILGCKGNVEELTTAYEKLIHAQNQTILSQNSDDIKKSWEKTLKQANGYDIWENIGNTLSWDGAFGGKMDDYDMKIETAEWLGGLTSYTSRKDIENFLAIGSDGFAKHEIVQALQNAGYDVEKNSSLSTISEVLEKALDEESEKIQGILDNYYAQFDEAVSQYKTMATALLSEAFDVGEEISGLKYGNISEELQSLAYQTVNSLDFKSISKITESGKSLDEWTKELLNQLNSIGKSTDISSKINDAFELQTQFNGGDIKFGDYVAKLKEVESIINNADLKDEAKTQLKISLGLDENGVVEEYERLSYRLATSFQDSMEITDYDEAFKKATELLDDLTAEEYAVVVDLVTNDEIDFSNFDLESLREYIEKEAELLKAMNFTIAIDVEAESVDAFNAAMAESVSATGLSSTSIAALKGRYAELEAQGYDLSSMFEETSNGIHLNRDAVNELEQAYASKKLSEAEGNLNTLKNRYDELTEEINICRDAGERAALYKEQQSIIQKINDLGTLTAQYEGLTSAYNAWLSAEESGQERDMYENIIEGFENIDDEISRGWYDDGTIKFLEMLTGRTDLAGKSAKELKEIYNGLDKSIKYIGKDGKVLEDTGYSVRDFFTVDDEGNSTADGVYNFLDAIGRLEEEAFGGKDVVKRNKNGKPIAFDFELAGGDEAIADALGVSEELVQIMKRASADAGFVVTLDGSWTQFADLQNQAEEANDKIKKLAQTNDSLKKAGFGDYEFRFDASSIQTLDEDLSKAKELLNNPAFQKDGKFNIDAKGAKDALKIAETLTIAKNQLEQPAYMSVDASKLQEELQQPVKLLQQFETLTQEKDLLNLTGTDTKRLGEINTELDTIVTSLSELDEETKVKLGIDGMTPEEIRKELENGTIEIPTELTIEANMDKSLQDLVTLGLLEQGLITEAEAKVRLGISVEEVDTSDIEKKIEESDLTEDQKVTVLAVAEVLGAEDVDTLAEKLDGLKDKQIQALAKVLGQINVDKLKTTIGNLDNKTVEAIAKALGEGDVEGLKSTISGLDDKTVLAIAKAFGYDDVNDLYTAIDELDPKTVEAIAQALGIKDVDSLRNAVNRLTDKNVSASATVSGKDEVDSLQASIDNLKGKTVTIFTKIVRSVVDFFGGEDYNGNGVVNGTANANGTAFADGITGRAFKQGDWRTKKTETALVGELGRELVVTGNRWYTVGDTGAEFATIPKGSIVFNHKICGIA